MPVHYVRNTDPGAPALSGQVGTLLTVLDEALILGRLFTTPDDVTFTDRSAEARLDGGAAFPLFPTPGTGDRAYFGMSIKFKQLIFDLDTLSQGGAYVWEYWNGAAWQALTVTDGTSGFTHDGAVSWTPPADWATTTVNGQTRYWVRVRPTAPPTTNPTVFSVSTLGWLRAFEGTNKAAYKQAAKSGFLRFFWRIDDSGPGADGARMAWTRGFESMTDVDTGTGDFPTTVQAGAGITFRKSSTLDATARTYIILADGRTVYLFVISGDVSGYYTTQIMFGDIYSYTQGDQYGCAIIGNENASGFSNPLMGNIGYSIAATMSGHYLVRAYSGVSGAIRVGKFHDYVRSNQASGGILGHRGLSYTNPPDGRLHMSRIWINENPATPGVRGHLRGLWAQYHDHGNFNDGDTWQGVDDLASRAFRIIKPFNTVQSGGSHVIETSDTWDTN
jgi:hypothetical protein